MSANITLVQRKSRKNLHGNTPISLRITLKRESRYIPTGVSIPECDWDQENHRIKPQAKDFAILQCRINEIESEWRKRIAKMEACEEELSFDTLLGKKLSKASCYVEDYFSQQIQIMKDREKIGTASKYQYCLKLLKQCNSVRVTFDQIDLTYLRRFETFLINRGNMSNSIATKFSVLAAVYNKAQAEGLFDANINPFKLFKPGRFWKETRKRAISKEDIGLIKGLDIEYSSSPYSVSFARDIFLFSYYVAGINFKDIATIRYLDICDGRLYYQRHKTGKELNYKIRPEVQDILFKYSNDLHSEDDYIFPILYRSRHKSEQQIYNRLQKILKVVNRNLRELAKEAGIEAYITSYVARHTFATVLKRSGVSIEVISESLGHADITTTQIYLDSFENSQIDDALSRL